MVRDQKVALAVALAVAVAVAVAVSVKSTEKSGVHALPDRDWGKLNTRFAARLRRVFEALEKLGFKPVMNEGWRSKERAEKLASSGKGVVLSMHCFGLAADVRDADTAWSDPKFFAALGAAAEAEGLAWGGRFSRVDATHVQAVPVRGQARVRREAATLGEVAAAQRAVERWLPEKRTS